MGNGLNLSEACTVQLLRGQGESYDIKSAFDLVDGIVKNATPDKSFSPIDGKGPLLNEISAAVEKKDGVFTVNSSPLLVARSPLVAVVVYVGQICV